MSHTIEEKPYFEHRNDDNSTIHNDFGVADQLKIPGETVHIQDLNLDSAIKESKIAKFSKSTLHLYFAIFVAFCNSIANGYDGSLFTGILAMPYFQATYGTGETGSGVALLACLYTIGQMVGSPLGAYISDRFGRRAGMFSGCALCIVGTIISAAGHVVPTFAIGRFILGFGVTIATNAAPAYTMEISPPQWRGRCTGLYNCGWFGGSIPAAAVTFGCSYIQSDFSWRVPLILQSFACGIVCLSVPFIPESPRFLMANGRGEEALAFLTKYHGGGDVNSKLVQLEWLEFKEGISQTGSDKRWWDYRVLVDSKNHRWRSLQALMMAIAGQYSGNGLSYFNTVIYSNLGIKSVTQQLAYNLLNQAVSALGALFGALLTDTMPRRKILTFGTLACACLLAVNAGLQSIMNRGDGYVPPASIGQGALAAYMIFGFVFMFTYTPLQAVVPVEALETTMRAKGLAAQNIVAGSMGFLNQFAGPIALGNIGYKYVYVFVAWDTVEAGLWYLLGVESQGRTLEELEWVYDQPNPVKASLSLNHIVGREEL